MVKMSDEEIKKLFEHTLSDLVISLSRPVVTEDISVEDFAYATFRVQEARCNFENALLLYAQVFHRLS